MAGAGERREVSELGLDEAKTRGDVRRRDPDEFSASRGEQQLPAALTPPATATRSGQIITLQLEIARPSATPART